MPYLCFLGMAKISPILRLRLPAPLVRLSVMTRPNELHVISHYESLVSRGELSLDQCQLELIHLLQKIDTNAHAYIQGRLADAALQRRPRGLYIFGDVGTGKTVVMDAYFHSSRIVKKRRVHFHKFMLEIHSRIHIYKQQLLEKYGRQRHLSLSSERDAVVHVARLVAAEAHLLCFDEFQVLDICDAMILTKLFSEIWQAGTVLIATSNRPPDDLYKGGLNRDYFLPFLERLKAECIVRAIGGSEDYRSRQSSLQNAFYSPASDENRSLLWADFTNATDEIDSPPQACKEMDVPVIMGRMIRVWIINDSTCWADFRYLCDEDRGAADYQALARQFEVVFVADIPVMSIKNHDRARRFITLVDELYDSGCLLRWTADATPQSLFRQDHSFLSPPNTIDKEKDAETHFINDDTRNFSQQLSSPEADSYTAVFEGALASVAELSFAFKRTSSRLKEMASHDYFVRWKKRYKIIK